MKRFKSINGYILSLGKDDQRDAKALRDTILSCGPFKEKIAYNMPAFSFKEKIIACFLICKNHIGYYPYSGTIIPQFEKELSQYKKSQGAVQFPKGHKVPKLLIKKLIQARIKELN